MVKIENQKTTGTLTNEAINILSDALDNRQTNNLFFLYVQKNYITFAA